MKKFIIIFIIIIFMLVFGGCNMYSSLDKKNTLYWIPEKSGFVDYEIIDEKIKFSYSIYFVNDSKDDVSISLSAKFKANELKGWIKNQDFFIGYDKNGDMLKELISEGVEKNVIFYFEGDYLNGDVNRDLSFPEEIILMS